MAEGEQAAVEEGKTFVGHRPGTLFPDMARLEDVFVGGTLPLVGWGTLSVSGRLDV